MGELQTCDHVWREMGKGKGGIGIWYWWEVWSEPREQAWEPPVGPWYPIFQSLVSDFSIPVHPQYFDDKYDIQNLIFNKILTFLFLTITHLVLHTVLHPKKIGLKYDKSSQQMNESHKKYT